MYWWHCIKGNQSIEHIHNLLENTREFPYFSNWNRPCRWIQVVFQRRLISFKRMWYLTTIIWKHDTSVSPGVKTMYFHSLWCLPACQTKRRIYNYCLWEVHDLNLFTVILHFMSHTYSVVPNASKWRYILFSLLGWKLFLYFAAFWT